MRVDLEFFGLARITTGVKELSLDLDEGTTFRQVVRILSSKYPDMIGDVINSDGETLHPPNIFNLNAKRMIHHNQMDECPSDGDRIVLMSVSAGG
jgi:molybdopterin converting factor small subunit